ncbi:hypothetical protein EYF80_032755 [Liparis tanakae]|uniref:Uncharacterized protein n=1 Tax=Liparis tanakae TaxID=230148 RepID=A0A4Z2GWS4_9TELE|nr:hypothetical protein EYF80_032755 [Liparis tanakae]
MDCMHKAGWWWRNSRDMGSAGSVGTMCHTQGAPWGRAVSSWCYPVRRRMGIKDRPPSSLRGWWSPSSLTCSQLDSTARH